MNLVLTETISIPAPRAAVYAASMDMEQLAACFRGFPPLVPGIQRIVYDGSGGLAVGATRLVYLADGSKVRERVLVVEPLVRHRYDMAEMNAMQRLLCTNMIADWTFADEGQGATRISWNYEIQLRSALLWPVAKIVGWAFGQAMRRCLGEIARKFSAASPRSS